MVVPSFYFSLCPIWAHTIKSKSGNMQNFIGIKNDVALFFQIRICFIVTAVNVYQAVFLITVNFHLIRHQRV